MVATAFEEQTGHDVWPDFGSRRFWKPQETGRVLVHDSIALASTHGGAYERVERGGRYVRPTKSSPDYAPEVSRRRDDS